MKQKLQPRNLTRKRRQTYLRMLRSIIGTAVVVIIILIVLQCFGINVSSMLAGVGITSIVVGFALQDALKDIIRGFEIVRDGYYDIGDLIHYDGIDGRVLSVNLHTTKIEDINTGNIISIANRNIDRVEIDAGYILIAVPLPYELPVTDAEKIMAEIATTAAKDSLIKSCEFRGLTDLSASSLDYQLFATCEPLDRLQARRNCLRAVMTTLESHHISVPYTQLDLHTKS